MRDHFDAHGNPWIATGQDGQFLKIDRAGRVLGAIGAIGNGMDIEAGQFIEASCWALSPGRCRRCSPSNCP